MKNILYVTQVLDEGTGYTTMCNQALQYLQNQSDLNVTHYPFDCESLEPWNLPHLIQPYETLVHDTDKFRELVQQADLMIFQMPLMGGRPPEYLMNSTTPKVFILHDILFWCSSFGINSYTRMPCSLYKDEGRCFNCNDYMGAFVTETFSKMYYSWEYLMSQPSSTVISPSKFIRDTYLSQRLVTGSVTPENGIRVLPHPILDEVTTQWEDKKDHIKNVLIPSFSEFKTDFSLLLSLITENPTWTFKILADNTKVSPITYHMFSRLNNVVFAGNVPHEGMTSMYLGSPYVLHTSIAEESFGLVVGEALARNCKVFLWGRGAMEEWNAFKGVTWLNSFGMNDLDQLVEISDERPKFKPLKIEDWCSQILNYLV